MEHFVTSPRPNVALEQWPERSLGLVSLEGFNLLFEVCSDVDDGGRGRERHRLAIGQGEICGGVVELLRLMDSNDVMQLIGISVVARRPLESQCRRKRCHGVVGVARQSTFRTECNYHLGTKLSYVQRHIAGYSV